MVQSFYNRPLISEHAKLKLRHNRNVEFSHLFVENHDKIIGYALIDRSVPNSGPSVWILVDPFFQGGDIHRELLKNVLEIYGDSVRIWVHGNQPELSALLSDFDFLAKRIILVMHIDLSQIQLNPRNIQNFVLRNFAPGTDNYGWLSFNHEIFQDHPEQGNWNVSDLSMRINEKWFDKQGFFVAELNNKIIGSIWTKIHESFAQNSVQNDRVQTYPIFGEIYILAVAKNFQGLGIGKDLTTHALNYFKKKRIYNVILYIDNENKKALKLYKDLGFLQFSRDIMYTR